MPTVLVVRFLAGRYRATPWGPNVDEGQVELPPSPWRLLRALYAVWKTRVLDLDEVVVHALLTRLAAPPTYVVPPFRLSHTHHWLPDSTSRSGTASTDKTLDAFAVLDRGSELAVRWPEDLPPEEHKALSRLAESLPYLGRADSICEARVDDLWEPPVGHTVCGPMDVAEQVGDGRVRPLLSPLLPLDIAALTLRPVDVRAGRLLFPRSTRFVAYAEPAERSTPPTPRRRLTTWPTRPVEAVRFTVTARARPPETDAVVLADRLRGAGLRELGRLRPGGREDSMLAGRGSGGALHEGHRHAHFLALSGDERRIDEVAVWAPGGLAPDEVAALSRVRELWGPEGAPGPGRLQVRMSAYGDASTVLGDMVGPSRRWVSVTPFVPSRHAKGGWDDFLAAEVRRELAHRGLDMAVEVTPAAGGWQAYMRYRPSKRFSGQDADRRSARPGAFLRLTFASPVTGPLALGHLSHFGLGLFRPELDHT